MKLMAKIGSALCVFAFFMATIAQGQSQSVKTTAVQFSNGKENVGGFLIEPDKLGRYPGLIVAPEWRGVTDWIKDQATKLAGQGYVILAVDFYGGKVAVGSDEAAELASHVSSDTALADLQGAFTYLQTLKEVDRDHIGVIGWGTGGGYALKLAVHQQRLVTCVVNYGVLPTDPNDIQQIFAAVLGNFGADDHGVTAADVRAFEKTMQGLGRRIDIKIYDGAGSAFENSTNADAYRPDAAEDAWKRTVDFLGKLMK